MAGMAEVADTPRQLARIANRRFMSSEEHFIYEEQLHNRSWLRARAADSASKRDVIGSKRDVTGG